MKEAGALNLYSGPGEHGYLSTFEVNLEEGNDDPDKLIIEFIRIFQSLGFEAKNELRAAGEIAFDLGYESDTAIEPTAVLKTDTLAEMNSLATLIRITTYEPTPKQKTSLD